MKLVEIGNRIGADVVGDGDLEIRAVRALDTAGPKDLSFLHNPKYESLARSSDAGAIIVQEAGLLPGRNLLVSSQPYLAFAKALEIMCPKPEQPPGIHRSAVVEEGAAISPTATIGALAHVAAGARVGEASHIGPGCVLGADAVIGNSCHLHPRVVVEDRCVIGDRCIIHAGVVIGSDGYGFATVEGVHHKVPQTGTVVIEDDVEVGANVCIDRGTLGETRVGRGTKIDNLVQIAHNVQVGEHCLLVAQVGISGSTELGHHVVMAGQCGAAGHLKIGNGTMISAKSAVMKDLPDGAFVSGIPARPHREWLIANGHLQRLGQLQKQVRDLQRRLKTIEEES